MAPPRGRRHEEETVAWPCKCDEPTWVGEDFERVVPADSRVIESKATIPILSHLLFRAEREGLELLATDLEIGLRTRCPADVTAPVTVSGRAFHLHDNYLGVNCIYLTQHIGTNIEAMIGADIIKEFTLGIFPNEQLVQFNDEPAAGEIVIPVQNFMGIPIITIGVNVRVMRVFFDTAAPMSYLLPEAFKGQQAYGRQEDFYPLLGNFLTDVYHLPVNIGGECRELRFGELPEELRTVLDAGGVKGILGTEILKHFGMCLSLRDGVMKLETPYGIPRDTLRA